MCGISGIFQIKQPTDDLRQKVLRMSQKLRHRGPDWSGIYVGQSAILAHERLSISLSHTPENRSIIKPPYYVHSTRWTKQPLKCVTTSIRRLKRSLPIWVGNRNIFW